MHPTDFDFNHEHCQADQQNGSSHHSKGDPRKSIALARLAARFLVSYQEQSKVGEVIGLTTQKTAITSLSVGSFGSASGEAFVFAFPFGFAFVKIA